MTTVYTVHIPDSQERHETVDTEYVSELTQRDDVVVTAEIH